MSSAAAGSGECAEKGGGAWAKFLPPFLPSALLSKIRKRFGSSAAGESVSSAERGRRMEGLLWVKGRSECG